MRWMVALIWRLPPRSRRWRLVLPELTGIGATPAARASLASVAKRWAPAISPTSLAAVSGPKPGSVSSCGAIWATRSAISALERLDRLGELADAAQLVAGDADAHRLLGAREPAGDPRAPAAVEQRAARQLQLGPEVVQMPLQRVVERDALADQPLAVIDEQPQVELGTVQLRGRQRVQAFAQRRPGDRDRVDAVGLPAPASVAPRRRPSASSRRAGRARRGRSETAQRTPRRAGSPRSPRPARRPGRAPRPAARRSPWRPTWTVCSPTNSPVAAATAAIVCERLWVSAPSTIIDLVHLHLDLSGHPADTACWGRCHAPIKSRRTSPTGDERHSER